MTDTNAIRAQLLNLLVQRDNGQAQLDAVNERISALKNFLSGVEFADSEAEKANASVVGETVGEDNDAA